MCTNIDGTVFSDSTTRGQEKKNAAPSRQFFSVIRVQKTQLRSTMLWGLYVCIYVRVCVWALLSPLCSPAPSAPPHLTDLHCHLPSADATNREPVLALLGTYCAKKCVIVCIDIFVRANTEHLTFNKHGLKTVQSSTDMWGPAYLQ